MSSADRILWLEVPALDHRAFEPLRRRYPDLVLIPAGVVIPLAGRVPEEVLAACCAEGLPVRGSLVKEGGIGAG